MCIELTRGPAGAAWGGAGSPSAALAGPAGPGAPAPLRRARRRLPGTPHGPATATRRRGAPRLLASGERCRPPPP
eukprot:10836893-Heterocapsa_arctica.AAC.1